MKRIDTLIKVTIIFTLVLFICSIDDFLSLHDIKKDYVSKTVLQYLDIETSKELPNWTNTELEWLSVTVSHSIRFSLIIILLTILVLLKKNILKIYEKQSNKL